MQSDAEKELRQWIDIMDRLNIASLHLLNVLSNFT